MDPSLNHHPSPLMTTPSLSLPLSPSPPLSLFPSPPLLSIIIVNWNTRDLLAQCLPLQ